jgi:hypothetical protein
MGEPNMRRLVTLGGLLKRFDMGGRATIRAEFDIADYMAESKTPEDGFKTCCI